MWLSLWYICRIPAAIVAVTAVLYIVMRQRPWGIRFMAAGAGVIVLLAACYPLLVTTIVIAQDWSSKSGGDVVLSSVNYGTIKQDYPLRISQYRPEEGGTNCDSDCTTMASGDRVADWVGGRNGVYAAACPREGGWRHGEQFTLGGVVFECRDTGGWINCYDPGERDLAIANAHSRGYMLDVPAVAEELYCWVDLLGSWDYAYGDLVYDWARVREVTVAGSDNPFLPYRGIDPAPLNDIHGAGNWPGRDYLTPEGTPLYAPEICPCKVVRSGFDGYVGAFGSNNSYLQLQSLDGTYDIMYMHGRYTASGVVSPGQPIGTEASLGNSTDPHTHVSVRKNGVLLDPEDY